jgi:hypothetical protein
LGLSGKHFLSVFEALVSISSTAKKKNSKGGKRLTFTRRRNADVI